jgi:uncharacterized protein YndB with AHSA1/START domain
MTLMTVSRSREMKAPPEKIFNLLADPSRHGDFDGSGTVRTSVLAKPPRLALGSKFGMNMKLGVPYRMSNTVTEFVEGRQIGWAHIGGHVWRYELSSAPGGTLVTETFDGTTSKSKIFLRLTGAVPRNTRSIEATLKRLALLVEAE